MDWSLFFLGILMIFGSLSGFRRPEKDVHSVEGWQGRLRELKEGADEAYFEERRQLEAYPPPAHATAKKVRVLSMIGIASGVVLMIAAFLP
ncbi:hypothetical protein K3179_01065 [Qipengyuania sp. GH38]|uniref:hypothetical protein n=1 Tax=Qipengyuania intermedia TaxID=2867244 RepID=UPI001C8836CF|nr:hypothetical protein [Qipengyuania intermedia]MBX7513129.1 hypothetical protein [Qipengyuania intermedia]